MAHETQPTSIGIDLGTTNSCVAFYDTGDQQVEVLVNDVGCRRTPSCVSFDKGRRHVGQVAKEKRVDNPKNTVFGVKRIIGREFWDWTVQEDMKYWPYQVVNVNGKPSIQVSVKGKVERFRPEQISGFVLERMKQIAEDRIGKVYNAVITVPAYFNDSQRTATMQAGKLAGLNVMGIISEPTAAAIAYGMHRRAKEDKRTVLVYDLARETFDATLLKIEGLDFDIITKTGDTHLGGDDFDRTIANYFAKDLVYMYESEKKAAMAKLLLACEIAKIDLSSKHRYMTELTVSGKRMLLTRANFEDNNRSLFMKTFDLVEKMLQDAEIDKSEIDDVILVGGSTQIPFIQQELARIFGGHKLRKQINPVEAVAIGAGVYAAHLSGIPIPGVSDFKVRDVTPLSLGIEDTGGITSVIMKRNTKIPATKVVQYETAVDDQTIMAINVYEGERVRITDNHWLDGFPLEGIPKMPAGQAKVDVKFSIDCNSMLHVSAWETTTGKMEFIEINPRKGRRTQEEINILLEEAEKWRASDKEFEERVKARNNAEKKILELKRISRSRMVLSKCKEVQEWLDNHREARREDILEKHRELEALAWVWSVQV